MRDWFYRLFHRPESKHALYHQFGRDINAQINPEEPKLFAKAAEAFHQGDIVQAYHAYLSSLENFTNAKSNHNVTLDLQDETLYFTLYQGCAVVQGEVTKKSLRAHSVISQKKLMDVAVKRHLLERNDLLTYVSYGVKKQQLILQLYLDNSTMTPQKVFYPLRELALNADYEKEYLHYHFHQKELTEVEHLEYLSENELQLKYQAMQTWIENTLKTLQELPSNDNNTTVSFTLLTLLFQIDYLLVPHLDMMQELFEKVNSYFTEDERLIEQKNDELLEFTKSLQKLSFEDFSRNFYKAKLTFSPTEHTTFSELREFIEGSLEKYRWFRHHRYLQVASIMTRYIPLYLLYNYGLHPSYRALLHLLVEIQHSDFFVLLGYEARYHSEDGSFEKRSIKEAIEEAITPYRDQFPALENFAEALNYTTLDEFSHSYFLHLLNLDYTER